MKMLLTRLTFLIGLILTSTSSAEVNLSPDLFIQTRMENSCITWLIEKTRLLMSNAQVDDHLEGEVTIDETPSFDLDDITDDPHFAQYRDSIASLFNVDLVNASIRVRIPKVYYKIKKLDAKPLQYSVKDPTFDLQAQALLSGIDIKLNHGIFFDFMIPDPQTHVLTSYFTASIAALSLHIPDTTDPLSFEVTFQTIRDQELSFKLNQYNFDSIPGYVSKNFKNMTLLAGPEQAPFGANSIQITPVTIKINTMSRTVTFDEFKPLIQRHMPEYLNSIFGYLAKALRKKLGKTILSSVFSSTLANSIIVQNQYIYNRFTATSFSEPAAQQFSLGVHGDLCTADQYQHYQELCTEQVPPVADRREISDSDREKAHEEVNTQLAKGTADIAVSVSEEYVNRLLSTTIDADLWNAKLEAYHLALGEKGAFVIFDERTKAPALYLDLLYSGERGISRILVNENHPLHFPLRISTSASFTIKEGLPYFNLKTEKVLSDADEIIHGIPDYDLESHTIIGFRKKIAKKILSMAEIVEGQPALEMAIPVFQGIGLENTTYEVSPFGRLNLYFKL